MAKKNNLLKNSIKLLFGAQILLMLVAPAFCEAVDLNSVEPVNKKSELNIFFSKLLSAFGGVVICGGIIYGSLYIYKNKFAQKINPINSTNNNTLEKPKTIDEATISFIERTR